MSNPPHSFKPGDLVELTEPCRGLEAGLAATVVSMDPSSGKVIVAPWSGESQAVFLSVEPSCLRRSKPLERALISPDNSGEQERSLQAVVAAVLGVLYEAEAGETGRWLFVSHRIEELLGYSPEEWLADPNLWFESIHPDDRLALSEEEQKALQRDLDAWVLAAEYRMIRRDGEVIWVRDDARLDFSVDPPLWRGALSDITASRHAQELLTDAVERSSDLAGTGADVFPPGGSDVFRLECEDCEAVWAARQVEGCPSCGADSVEATSFNAMQVALAEAQQQADVLLRGIEDHLSQLEASKERPQSA